MNEIENARLRLSIDLLRARVSLRRAFASAAVGTSVAVALTSACSTGVDKRETYQGALNDASTTSDATRLGEPPAAFDAGLALGDATGDTGVRDGGPVDLDPCSRFRNASSWQLQTDVLLLPNYPDSFTGISGTSDRDVWASGGRGALFHFDGTTWTAAGGFGRSLFLVDVFARATNDVWTVGFDTVGLRPVVARYDGLTWSFLQAPAGGSRLWGVWASGPNDAWVVGEANQIFHYTGAGDAGAWAAITPAPAGPYLAVTGTSARDVWVVGDAGHVIRFDGETWTTVRPQGTRAPVVGTARIFEVSPTDVWVASSSVGIMHYDGTSWAVTASGAVAIRAFAPNDVWAAGAHGVIEHFDGFGWCTASVGGSNDLDSLWGTSRANLWVGGIGPELLRYEGR